MPSVAQSPASSSAHRNVTAVVGYIDALSIEVTVCGDRCALYLQTSTGQMIVRLPAARFVAAARAERDSNGKPFPALEATSRELKLRQLEADADATRSAASRFSPAVRTIAIAPAHDDGVAAPLPPPRTEFDRLADLPPLAPVTRRADRNAQLRAAWELFIASPSLNYVDFGHQLECAPSLLRRSFDALASLPGAPVLKPGGKL